MSYLHRILLQLEPVPLLECTGSGIAAAAAAVAAAAAAVAITDRTVAATVARAAMQPTGNPLRVQVRTAIRRCIVLLRSLLLFWQLVRCD